MLHELLRIGPRISVLPVVHGSGDCALAVRRAMLDHAFDCLAVPLPASFQQPVEEAIASLPTPTLVLQEPMQRYEPREWTPSEPREDASESDDDSDLDGSGDDDSSDEGAGERTWSYVPIDPCQPVIMALRIALGEHLPRAYIDLETDDYLPHTATLPDPYALKTVPVERFAAAILPSVGLPPEGQIADRVRHMAARLRELARKHKKILFVCSLLDWAWIRDAYTHRLKTDAEPDEVTDPVIYEPDPQTLLFLLGELPFITSLYEQARAELGDDENLSIDGVKQLVVSARDAYLADYGKRARRITPHTLSLYLKYVRNLSLVGRRMTPDLYSLVVAGQQMCGDGFALHVAETARRYDLARETHVQETPYPRVAVGIDRLRLPEGDIVRIVSRLPGPPLAWRSCQLRRKPERQEKQKWAMQWNPFRQCSWPPEDELIENFRSHVFERARSIIGLDLVKTEKFTTSIKDGIDIRDTMRSWHTGEIYVKNIPPARDKLDCAVMLFDQPADPRDYSWRTTWYAEHDEESTLAFFATDFRRELVGPGIALSTYGGALFLFPPLHIPDIWEDPDLDFADTLEDRLVAAACLHARSRHIALLSPQPPTAAWRMWAKRFHKRLVHVPLGQFSDATVQQLRMVHVLNGHQVRSYAEQFIRKP